MSTSMPLTTLKLTLPSDLFAQVEQFAKEHACSADDVVRDALEEFGRKRFGAGASVLLLPPLDLGETLQPLSPDDDLLEEMLEGNSTSSRRSLTMQ